MSTMLYFDCETSGVDPKRHAILQIAWIIKAGNEIIAKKCFDVKPEDSHDLNLKALEVNGFTFERMKAGIDGSLMTRLLAEDIRLAMGGGDALIPCGHNVRFDLEFLSAYLQKGTEKYTIHYGNSSALQMNRPVCTMALCHYLNYRHILHLNDYKLATVCGYFGIPIDAHDALSDIEATITLLDKLNKAIEEDVI